MVKFSQTDLKARILKSSNPKIGVIALSTDFTIEQDFRRICHNQNVDIYVNRIPFENPLTHENYLKMANYLPEIVHEIHKTKPNVYVSTPITAAIKSFSKMRINKIAVLTPYPKLVNETIFNFLAKQDIEITSFSSFNLEYDNDIANVDPQHLLETINKLEHQNADAIFVSCTALRAVEILDQAERDTSKFVISSNQALIWDTIRSVNINSNINGYGKLFLN